MQRRAAKLVANVHLKAQALVVAVRVHVSPRVNLEQIVDHLVVVAVGGAVQRRELVESELGDAVAERVRVVFREVCGLLVLLFDAEYRVDCRLVVVEAVEVKRV